MAPLTSTPSNSSDLFGSDDSAFLEALRTAVLPGDAPFEFKPASDPVHEGESTDDADISLEAPPCTQPGLKRRYLPDSSDDEHDEHQDDRTAILSFERPDSADISLEAPPCAQPGLKRRRVESSDDEDEYDRANVSFKLPSLYSTEDEADAVKEDDADVSLEAPPCAQPSLKRARLDEDDGWHAKPVFHHLRNTDDADDYLDDHTYGAAHFGEFGEYMRRKRAKLQVQNTALEDGDGKSALFKGLAIYINGRTEPSIQDLRKLIVDHGGVFHAYLDKKALVTHIITCTLTPAKIHEFQHMKVVRPEWLVQSVQAQIILPWRDFIFRPNERIETPQGRNAQAALPFAQRNPNPRAGFPPSPEDVSFQDVDLTPPEPSFASEPSFDGSPNSQFTPPRAANNGYGHGRGRGRGWGRGRGQARGRGRGQGPAQGRVPYTIDSRNPYAAAKSNPHAARAMADPAWRAAHTSAAPDFIEGYYRNSRLHHLSTWKAELRALVAEAQDRAERGDVPAVAHVSQTTDGVSMKGAELVLRNPLKGKGRERRAGEGEGGRVVMHVDFDAFFVSAGLVDRPQLRGKPVVVCHSQGGQGGAGSTSEIASASYEARAFGIKNGMSLQQARKLCPDVVTIPYEFERYKRLSLKFYTILMSLADDLQAVSVDEALIEVTSTISQMKVVRADDPDAEDAPIYTAKELAESIRARVRDATGCEVSIGIASNIMMARLATRKAKPAGSHHLLPADVPALIATLDIQDLHGFGWSSRDKALEKLGTTNLGDLVGKSKAALCEALGRGMGETLWKAVRGIDERKLESDKPRKSVSCEINYGIRFQSAEQAEAFLHQMAEEVTRRLKGVNMKGRSLTLKVMKRDPSAPVEAPKFLGHGQCLTYNKQSVMTGPTGRATDDTKTIGALAWKLLKSLDIPPSELRGLGIQIQKLENAMVLAPAAGQARLPFKRISGSRKRPASKAPLLAIPEIQIHPPSNSTEDQQQPPAHPDLPSFSQVDLSVLEALPADIRQELEAEYKRRSASPAAPLVDDPNLPALRHAANLERVARQLAPRGRGPVKIHPFLLRLFGDPAKMVKKKAYVRVDDAELRALDIDPGVFRSLPVKIQREQLAQARGLRLRPSQRPVRATKPLRPPKRLGGRWRYFDPLHEYIPPPPPPQARYTAPPVLKQPQPGGGKEKLVFWEDADVRRLLGEWVAGFTEHVPHWRDIEHFAKWLERSVESDGGMERAMGVMRWWGVLLRRRGWGTYERAEFEGWEMEGVEEVGRVTSEMVARAWWAAFREVKGRMNEVVRIRYGGKIAFR
ncbi:hypothetical protein OF83DRAFT_1283395 [Amylostereum chailletii]|nr:hypothetical protein OF83DRAFT_1283395 [Amylostereum chailletii]